MPIRQSHTPDASTDGESSAAPTAVAGRLHPAVVRWVKPGERTRRRLGRSASSEYAETDEGFIIQAVMRLV